MLVNIILVVAASAGLAWWIVANLGKNSGSDALAQVPANTRVAADWDNGNTRVRVDLSQLINSTLDTLDGQQGAFNIDRRVAPDLAPGNFDPLLVRDAFREVLLAVVRQLKGDRTIHLTLRNEEISSWNATGQGSNLTGHQLAIELTDGPPIRFHDRTLDLHAVHSGASAQDALNLFKVDEMIRSTGGTLLVSRLPRGLIRVTILLPAAPRTTGVHKVVAPTRADLEEPGEAILPGGSERILLVEDEAAVRSVTTRILARLGYTVDGAADAIAARESIAVNGWPDLMVTDIIMPGEQGGELVHSLLEDNPDLAVLFISGFAGDALRTGPAGIQGTSFLQKPFSAGELANRVRAVLDCHLETRVGGDWRNPAKHA